LEKVVQNILFSLWAESDGSFIAGNNHLVKVGKKRIFETPLLE
jgi:hypothetical protein